MHRFKSNIGIATIVAAALAGCWVCGTLLTAHGGGWGGPRDGTSFLLRLCEPTTPTSTRCSKVVDSRWGSFDVVLGGRIVVVPTSLIGLVYFAAVAVWFAGVMRIGRTPLWLWRVTLGGLACGIGVSVFFVGIMGVQLAAWCTLCIAAHVLNFALFVGTLWLAGASRRAVAVRGRADSGAVADTWERRRIGGGHAAVAGFAATVAAFGFWAYFDANVEIRRQWHKAHGYKQVIAALENDESFVMREYLARPAVDIPRRDPASRRNVPRVVIFCDFDAGSSACFHKRWRGQIAPQLPADVEVEYRYIAGRRGGSTNVFDDRSQETQSPAARAAVAVLLQSSDAEVDVILRTLFDHRGDDLETTLSALARAVGLDHERLRSAMSDSRVETVLSEDRALARRLAVSETPTVFLDGRRVPDLCVNSAVFWRAIARGFHDSNDGSHTEVVADAD